MTSISPATEESSGENSSTPSDRFFAAAIPRMLRFLLLLGLTFTAITAWRFGWIPALGFAAGTSIAYASFRSLNSAVQALASRIVDQNRPERGFSLVNGF